MGSLPVNTASTVWGRANLQGNKWIQYAADRQATLGGWGGKACGSCRTPEHPECGVRYASKHRPVGSGAPNNWLLCQKMSHTGFLEKAVYSKIAIQKYSATQLKNLAKKTIFAKFWLYFWLYTGLSSLSNT